MDVRDARAEYRVGPAHAAGEIPRGYKLTEIGVIPKDWDVKSLGEVCLKIQDGTHFSPAIRGGEYLYVTSKNVGFGALDVTDAPRIDESQHRAIYKRCDPKQGDLLLTKDGASTGNAALNTLNEEFSLLSSVAMLRFDERKHNAAYFLQQILSSDGQRRISEQMSGNAITRLTLAKINRLNFPVCELAEQRSIAEALSDASALLGALDRLIAKRRDLKQAAMQQLLTGQTRLPGFTKEWEMKRLGDYAAFLKHGVNSRAELIADGEVKYLHYGDIHGADGLLLDPNMTQMPCLSKSKASGLDRLSDGDLVFADASEDVDGVGKSVELCGVGQTEVVSGMHTVAVRFDKEVLADGFKAYLQFIPAFRQHLRRLAAGTKVYATNKAHVASAEVLLPEAEEQIAVAAVLADMDAEIEALEARRAKTRDLKQAMMQELLTGRTRLI